MRKVSLLILTSIFFNACSQQRNLTLSNEKYLTPTGDMYEVKGVDVDIKLTVFPKENIFNGHRDAVKQVVKIIENR